MQDDAQFTQRAEHLDAQHQNDEQGGDVHVAGLHPVGAPAQCDGGTDADPGVGNAARQRARCHHPHRALEQGVGLGLEGGCAFARLAEGLDGGEALDRIQELGGERAVGTLPDGAVPAVQFVPDGGREQDEERGNQQHQGDRRIYEGHEGEDQYRSQARDEELRQVLTEIGFELFDPFDHGEKDIAGPRLGEMRRAEISHVIVDHLPQMRLNDRRRPVRDHVPVVIEPAAQQHGSCDQCDRQDQGFDRRAAEHLAEKPAQQAQPRDANRHRQQSDEDGPGDAQSHAIGKGP